MHHMFTNIQLYDEDIQHEYKVYLFEFLYLKWRFDSLVSAIKNKNYVPFLRFRFKSFLLLLTMPVFITLDKIFSIG